METVRKMYGHVADILIQNSIQESIIDPNNVFQEANIQNRQIINTEIIRILLHPLSNIVNFSELQRLYNLSRNGRSCLIVMEHYSNFDLPNLLYILEYAKKSPEIASNVIAMAGMKLNIESDLVRAFTEAYTRIVIYPSRSLTPLIGTKDFTREQTKSREINRAALHAMIRQKHSGKMILIFPTGTRYRKGVPETRQGLSEVDSYIKGFDYFLPIAIAGNILRINVNGDMSEDYVHNDCVIFQAGTVIEAKKWRRDARSLLPESRDYKQHVADCIMDLLAELHFDADNHRRSLLATPRK